MQFTIPITLLDLQVTDLEFLCKIFYAKFLDLRRINIHKIQNALCLPKNIIQKFVIFRTSVILKHIIVLVF